MAHDPIPEALNRSLSEAVNSLLKDPISIDPEYGESDPENFLYNGATD